MTLYAAGKSVGPRAAADFRCRDGLRRPHERTHEFAIDLASELRRVQPGSLEKCRGILSRVHSRDLEVDLLEASIGEERAILLLLQSTGDASDPELHVPT